MSTAPRITLKVEDGIAWVTLANGANKNAMDIQFCREFAQTMVACETNPGARVIVIRAEGDFFGVGGDIRNFVDNKHRVHEHVLDMATQIHVGILAMRRAAAPVICAVNGMAAGGSFSLVCGTDVVIARRSAKFAPAFTKSGFTPDAGGTWFFPRIAGWRKAYWIMATNPVLTAEQAEQIGLVTQVVDDDKLDSTVSALARQFADMPPGALGGLKRLFQDSETTPLDQHLNAEARSIAAQCANPAILARLDAFFKK